MAVFDSSALLAYLLGEAGGEEVARRLTTEGGSCGAANWSEVAQKVRSAGMDWQIARAVLLGHELDVEPVDEVDAEQAAVLWAVGSGLSLADRLCLALGGRLDEAIVTADRAWGDRPGVTVIR